MDLSKLNPTEAKRLKLLHDRINDSNIPSSKLDESLNIATWNIREFGKSPRSEFGILCLATLLSQFDLIAITELRDNLGDLKRVLAQLGPDWNFLISDYQNDDGGNRERTAFLYDKRMVRFTGLAATAQPNRIKQGEEYLTTASWWRSPYFASFQAGDFDFILMVMHARWGKEASRVKELQGLSQWIKERWEDEADKVFDDDLILVGDFNIPKIGDRFYKALTQESRLQMPKALANIADTAASPGKDRYDQILHRSCDTQGISFANRGGVVDFAEGGLLDQLFPEIPKTKRTWELSDHFPLWVQVLTDNTSAKLDRIIQGA